MIKIPIDMNSSEIVNAIKKHIYYVKNTSAIKKHIRSSCGNEKEFYVYLRDNMEKIVESRPKELEQLIKYIEGKYWIGTPKVDKIFSASLKRTWRKAGGGKREFMCNLTQELSNQLKSLYNYNSEQKHLLRSTIDKIDDININKINNIGQLKEKIGIIQKDFDDTNNIICYNIQSMFDYNKFTSSDGNSEWDAYKLLGEINIRVCPYCNRQYISIYRYKTRPELDHFYPRSIYPYLGLSFYNLVPSCHVCNSNLKGSIDTYKLNLNPYESGFEDELKFSMKLSPTQDDINIINQSPTGEELKSIPNYTDFLLGNDENFEIEIVGDKNSYIGRRGMKNINNFKIKELYKNHRDIIQQIIKKAIAYNDTRINELFTEYKGTLFNSKEDVLEMLLSSYINKNDFSKRALSKFIRDISEELGILKYI